MRARYRWPLIGLASLIVLLVALHLALPYLVRDYLNDKLADMGDYRGQVADVDLAWWRGAYQINGLKIVKTTGKVPVPFLDAPLIDLSVSWHALWYDRAVVAEVIFDRPSTSRPLSSMPVFATSPTFVTKRADVMPALMARR